MMQSVVTLKHEHCDQRRTAQNKMNTIQNQNTNETSDYVKRSVRVSSSVRSRCFLDAQSLILKHKKRHICIVNMYGIHKQYKKRFNNDFEKKQTKIKIKQFSVILFCSCRSNSITRMCETRSQLMKTDISTIHKPYFFFICFYYDFVFRFFIISIFQFP